MIVLASQSASRKAMLEAAGVPFEARSSDVDEGEIKRELIGVPGCQVAQILAEAKAMPVSAAMPGRLVLGGDRWSRCAGAASTNRSAAPRRPSTWRSFPARPCCCTALPC
jgi:predicted house-cleaning NTP pyrophosphatase (Maf/HAM1 superfamily)